jgi:hypothetical protein
MFKFNVYDRVMINSVEGFGGRATVYGMRKNDYGWTSYYVMFDYEEWKRFGWKEPWCWAHDFEVEALKGERAEAATHGDGSRWDEI